MRDTGGGVHHPWVQFRSGSTAWSNAAHEPTYIPVKGWIAGNGVEACPLFQTSDVPVQAGVTAAAGRLRISTEIQGWTWLCGAEVRLRAVSEHRLALWWAPFEIGCGWLHWALHLQTVVLLFSLFSWRGLADALEFVLAVWERCQASLLRLGGWDAPATASRCDSDALVTLKLLVVLLHV